MKALIFIDQMVFIVQYKEISSVGLSILDQLKYKNSIPIYTSQVESV